jgi:DNA-binding FrmR family transcriptional regulator
LPAIPVRPRRLCAQEKGCCQESRVPTIHTRALYHTHLYYQGEKIMSHTVREKTKLLARVRRILGQVDAIERALEAEVVCADVLQVIASVRGAVDGLMAEVIEDHIRCHVCAPSLGAKERAEGADDLIEIVRSYLK